MNLKTLLNSQKNRLNGLIGLSKREANFYLPYPLPRHHFSYFQCFIVISHHVGCILYSSFDLFLFLEFKLLNTYSPLIPQVHR